MNNLLKTTIVGGVVFLLPVALVLFILGHALRMAKGVAEPISTTFHLDQFGEIAGMGIVTLISVLVLIVVSFVAGMVARTRLGKNLTDRLENSLLGGLPQYQLVKSMAEGLVQIENADGLKPALVSIEDGWQIGYQLETIGDGWVAVFLPQAPTPMSGNVMYLPADRVRPLDITITQAMALVKRIGVGSGDVLRGVDLSQPDSTQVRA